MTPKRVDREEKAAEIAAAALPVFRELGYHTARMADIAQAAGVGKGTVYEYFADKEAILHHELERYFADFEQGALAALSGAEETRARLEALIGFAFEHVEGWEDHCAAFFDAVGSARVSELGRDWFASMFAESHQLVRAIVEEGQKRGEVRPELDPDVVAELVVSLYEGHVLLGLFGVRCCPVAELRDGTTSLLEKGVLT